MPCKNHARPPGVPTLDYSYEEFNRDVHWIAEKFREKNYPIEKIFGVPRGGLPLAVHLCNLLKRDLWDGFPMSWSDEVVKKILIVDDIVDSGNTLKPYVDRGFLTAALFYDPKNSVVKPDIWARQKDERWIVFPWEV